MKLKPVIKRIPQVSETPKTAPRKSQENTLPPDEYKPMFPPIRMLAREYRSMRDPSREIKQYLELSVKRFNDDEGLPFVWLNMYQESDSYTGYLKGKTVHFPLELLYEVMDAMSEIDDTCTRMKIE